MIEPRLRLTPKLRKKSILEAAINIVIREGLYNLKQQRLAEVANINSALIHYYFKGMKHLRCAVIRHAKRNNISDVLCQLPK